MRLQVPFIQLPLAFDAAALAQEVAAIDEACWRPHPQGYPGNSMLPLVAVDGDPANESFAGPMRPTGHLQKCPRLIRVLDSLGTVLGRTRLMRLSGHAEVKPHVDQGYYWAERMRVHVPIVTQPTVRFECGGEVVNMGAGECWVFDTWRQHRVLNDADASRIHLVVDTVGGDGLWSLLAGGRTPAGSSAPWLPVKVALDGECKAVPLAFESSNVPVVMSPWELNAQLGLLFADVVPHPLLHTVQQTCGQFSRTWRSLWAHYGDAPEGHPHFREAMRQFKEAVHPQAQALQLRNDVGWYSAMVTLIAKFAVRDDESVSHATSLADL